MRKIFTLALSALFVAGVFAQQPEAVIMKASVAPVIDAEVDDVWAEANAYPVDKPFQAEVPTVDGTTWKALWNPDGIYVLIEVLDDAWLPMYLDNPPGSNTWEYDKPEVYFDVNYILNDGGGASAAESGHFQAAPEPLLDQNDGQPLQQSWRNIAGTTFTYSITVNDPDVNYEYFFPMGELLDAEGIQIDLTGTIGFDVTVIDRDPGDAARKRAVWANIGLLDESWNNMDDCGLATFDGAEAGEYVESVSLEDAVIDENNGMVQIMATVLPESAANKKLKWTIENGTGRATISSDGVVTGILDGTVTVTGSATDGSYMEDMCTVTISNQLVSFGEVNVIKNGLFDQVNANGTPAVWGGWFDGTQAATSVVDGVANMFPDQTITSAPADPQQWRYQFNQSGLLALPDVEYEFGFVAWADEDVADFPVDFEDIEGNAYRRYGVTTSPWSGDGRSEWHIPITSIPTKYTMDVTFDEILENTVQKVQYMPGLITVGVYLDSVYLVSADDMALISDYIAVEAITVSGPATVAVDGTAEMAAEVLPADALLTGVRWSVVNGTGEATIDASGVLTGVTAGVVTVVASAKDDSGVTGVKDVTVGVTGISQKSVNTLKVYPNPAVNELNVVLNAENSTVSIYNGVGQKMDEAVVFGSEYKFDISSYAAGIYFVKTGTSIAKFIK